MRRCEHVNHGTACDDANQTPMTLIMAMRTTMIKREFQVRQGTAYICVSGKVL